MSGRQAAKQEKEMERERRIEEEKSKLPSYSQQEYTALSKKLSPAGLRIREVNITANQTLLNYDRFPQMEIVCTMQLRIKFR